MRELGRQVDELEESAQAAEERMRQLLLGLPNLPLAEVPLGSDSDGNRIFREEGQPTELDFPGLPHWELGERLGIIDFQRGAKLSGSRFYTTSGAGGPAGNDPSSHGCWTCIPASTATPSWPCPPWCDAK